MIVFPEIYNEAYRRTAQHEGGYSDNKNDHGGSTKYGVSLRYLKSLGALGDIDHDGDIDQDDIIALTSENAKGFFYNSFWLETKCWRLYSEILQIKLFDTAVNMGPLRAQKIMQMALNKFPGTPPANLAEDGVLGAASIARANALLSFDHQILDLYRGLQLAAYRSLIAMDPTQKVFELGWTRRAAT